MFVASGVGYWILAALSGVLAAAALVGCLTRLRRDRFIADTPLVRIRSAAQGYVRIEGRAERPPGEDMRSPLSGRACVWWEYRVDCREEDSRGRSTYRNIERATSVTPFVLNDADGECLVGPVGANVTATSNDRWLGDSLHPGVGPPESGVSLLGGGSYMYHERLIAAGSRLSVLGELRSSTEFGAVDQKTREILEQWKRNQPGLLRRFDHNHDGRLDASEWDEAREQAHTLAERTVLGSPIERVGVVAQTRHGEPFIIAPLDGDHLLRREKRNALLLLLACLILLGTGLWALAKTEHSRAAPILQTGD